MRRCLFTVVAAALILAGVASAAKHWKDRDEFVLYETVNQAVTAKPPDYKRALNSLGSWKAKYPSSDYALERQQLYFTAHEGLEQFDKAIQAGSEALAIDPWDLRTLYGMTSLVPKLKNPTPEMLSACEIAARTLIDHLISLKPADVSDQDWQKVEINYQVLSFTSLGLIAQHRKDYVSAEMNFKYALQGNPNNGQVDFYLGTVILAQKKPETQEEALFYFARAAAYDGPGALAPDGRKSVKEYLTKAYNTYHGTQVGLDQLLAFARTHATPASMSTMTAASGTRRKMAPIRKPAAPNPAAKRRVVTRPNHVALVANRSGSGYVQRPFSARNQTLVARTYYVNHASYVRVYRPYVYHGVTLYTYLPNRYYAPAFYAWARTPWTAPVHYTWNWGWSSSAWYRYYNHYFKPDSAYSSPVRWLTDYLFANVLEAGYQETAATGNNPDGDLTPVIKQQIADEVQRQLDLERAQAENPPPAPAPDSPPPDMSGDGPWLFVVSHSLDVTASDGEACALTEGDVLQLKALPAENATAANVTVLARKDKDCRKDSVVSVSLDDLTEMRNRMHETIDQGLDQIRSQQGQGEIPEMPAAAAEAPVQPAFASALPPPDPNVARELSEGTLIAPPTVSLGQTPGQVTATLGQPAKIADLGEKQVYLYPDMKVIFTGGKVTDVQF